MVSDIALFFEPISVDLSDCRTEGTIGEKIQSFLNVGEFPEINQGSIAVFAVSENRRSKGSSRKPDSFEVIRRSFYQLKDHFGDQKILDLGNIGPGETVEDTYYAVTNSIASIVKLGGIAVMLGGTQDLTYANYLAYEKLEQIVNLTCVDSRFDLGDVQDDISNERFLQKIILHQPNILFNFSNLAYQTHHVLPKELDLLKKMYFDAYRLGEVQQNLEEVEPIVRNADVLSFDLSSIRSSDYPSNERSEPNGLSGQEGCAIARYAGLSDKVTSVGFYNAMGIGTSQVSAELVAQLLWYFIWGVSNRKKDYPFADKNEYTKYIVTLNDGKYDVIFYKSSRSDRWWMEVPYPSKRGARYQRHFMVPCSYQDYLAACEEEVPDRWWKTFQKLG